MVTNLEKMMVERLTLYRTRNGNQLPGRILVYRDGVSEVGSTCLFCQSTSSFLPLPYYRDSS